MDFHTSTFRDRYPLASMRRIALYSVCALAHTLSLVVCNAEDPILEIHASMLTTSAPQTTPATNPPQPVALQALHRGAALDGSVRRSWILGPVIAANPSDPGAIGDATVERVRLATGEYAPVEVDIALPSAGPAWVVGRSRTPLQSSGGNMHGRGWYQLSQPQLVAGATADVMFLVYAGDAFAEFRRVYSGSSPTNVFRGTNGCAGALVMTVVESGAGQSGMMRAASSSSGGGTPGMPSTYWTYHDPTGSEVRFFGADASWSGSQAKYQLWRISDTAGAMAYVGDPNDLVTAIVSGYDSLGRIKVAHDAAGRQYQYTYGVDGALNRLLRVVATNTSGSEVARVEYDYYDASSPDAQSALNGTLRLVTTHTPCSPSSSGQGSSIQASTYYRYWVSTSGSPIDGFQRGVLRSVRLVVPPESFRRASLAYPGTSVYVQTDTTLAAYAADRLGYASGRVAQLSTEGLATRRWDFSRVLPSSPPTNPGYDQAWAQRVDVALKRITGGTPTLERTTSVYFDEVGQRLSSVVQSSVAGRLWCTYVERNAAGQVKRVGSPASVSSWDASLGTFTGASSGLTTRIERIESPHILEGFAWRVAHSLGWNGAPTKDLDLSYAPIGGSNFPQRDLGVYVIRRPLVQQSRVFEVGNTNDDGIPTTFAYAFHSTSAGTPQALSVAWMKTTLPAVTAAQHGSGTSTETAVAFLPSGRPWLVRAVGDQRAPLAYLRYAMAAQPGQEASGQVVEVVEDADPAAQQFGLPAGFLLGSLHPVPRSTSVAYDAQGRVVRADRPDGLSGHVSYRPFGDGRVAVLAATSRTSMPGSYLSPGSLSVHALSGVIEAGGAVGLGASSTIFGEVVTSPVPPSDWLNGGASHPLQCLSPGLTLSHAATAQLDAGGFRTLSSRAYFAMPSSGDGTAGTHFDASHVGYDLLGRATMFTDPTGTIDAITFDDRGRVASTLRGLSVPSLRTIATLEYDHGFASANGLVTKVVGIDDIVNAATWRTTKFWYDQDERVRAISLPDGPHPAVRYDNLGRVVSSGLYSGSATSFDSLAASGLDPSAVTTQRLSLTQHSWDALGRAYRSVTTTGTGSDAVQQSQRTWFDPRGRVSLSHGASSERFDYVESTWPSPSMIQSTCALGALPSSYAAALSVQPTDHVLREVHHVFDTSRSFLDAVVNVDRHPARAGVTIPGGPLAGAGLVDASGNVDYTIAPHARVSTTRFVRDTANRTITAINFGNARYEPVASGAGTPAVVNQSLAGYMPGQNMPATEHIGRKFVAAASFMQFDEFGRPKAQYNQRGDFSCRTYDEAGRTVTAWSGIGTGLANAITNAWSTSYVPERRRWTYSSGRIARVDRVNTATGAALGLVSRIDYADTVPTGYPFASTQPRPIQLDDRRVALRTVLPGSTTQSGSISEDVRWNAANAFGETAASIDPAGIVWNWVRDPRGRATSVEFDYANAGLTANGIPEVDDIVSRVTYEIDPWGRVKGGEQFTSQEIAVSLGATSTDQCGCGCTTRVGNEARIAGPGGVLVNPIGSGTAVPSPMSTHYAFNFGQGQPGQETQWTGMRTTAQWLPPAQNTSGQPSVTRGFDAPGGIDGITGNLSWIKAPAITPLPMVEYGHWGIRPSKAKPIQINPDGKRVDPLGRDQTNKDPMDPGITSGGDEGMITPMMIHPIPEYDDPATDLLVPSDLVIDTPFVFPGTSLIPTDPNAGGVIWHSIWYPPVTESLATGYKDNAYHPAEICQCTSGDLWGPSTGLDHLGLTNEDRWTWCAGIDCTPEVENDPPATDKRYREGDDQLVCCGIIKLTPDYTNPPETKKEDLIYCGIASSFKGPDAAQFGNELPSGDIRFREFWRNPDNAAQTYDARGNWLYHRRERSFDEGQSFVLDFVRTRDFNDADQATHVAHDTGAWVTHTNPRYDRRGNLRDDGNRVYQYDAFNRLTRVYARDSAGNAAGELARFFYDAFGHRTSARYDSNTNGTTTDDPADLYAYDDRWRVVAVARHVPVAWNVPAKSWVREQWIYHAGMGGPGVVGPDSPIARRLDADGDGVFEDTQFFLGDRQGSTLVITTHARDTSVPPDGVFDRPGDILAKVTYTAFGEPVVHHPLDFDGDGRVGGEVERVDDFAGLLAGLAAYGDLADPHRQAWGNFANPSRERLPGNIVDPVAEIAYFNATYPQQARDLEADFGNLPLYAGYWWDPQLKLYHVRNRVYDPSAGRWLQRDPIGYAGGLNLYQYVGNMPGGAVDPTGLYTTMFGNLARKAGMPGLAERIDDAAEGVTSGLGVGAIANKIENWQLNMDLARQARNAVANDANSLSASEVTEYIGGSAMRNGFNQTASDVGSGLDLALRTAFPYGDAADGMAKAIEVFAKNPSLASASQAALVFAAYKVHGNTAGDQVAHLYARFDKDGNFMKWGITQDLATRYGKKELGDDQLRLFATGTRRNMVALERALVEVHPGPMKREPWAVCLAGSH